MDLFLHCVPTRDLLDTDAILTREVSGLLEEVLEEIKGNENDRDSGKTFITEIDVANDSSSEIQQLKADLLQREKDYQRLKAHTKKKEAEIKYLRKKVKELKEKYEDGGRAHHSLSPRAARVHSADTTSSGNNPHDSPYDFSFTPEISPRGRQKARPGSGNYGKRLYNYEMEAQAKKQTRIQQMQAEKLARTMAACPFLPQINDLSKSIIASLTSSNPPPPPPPPHHHPPPPPCHLLPISSESEP
mmetsp:Transcript_34218/g.57459  ORF Transcript_34218/g.57459 Transcript_34218/m.57459 type:complete len:245 (-) Transcript_34218:2789-3523(-)